MIHCVDARGAGTGVFSRAASGLYEIPWLGVRFSASCVSMVHTAIRHYLRLSRTNDVGSSLSVIGVGATSSGTQLPAMPYRSPCPRQSVLRHIRSTLIALGPLTRQIAVIS